MITVDYLRGERDQVAPLNPVMRQTATTPRPFSRIVQWRFATSRRANIALRSLSAEDQRAVSEIINAIKKIPSPNLIAENEVRRFDSERFSVLFVRRGNIIEIIDILNRRIVDEIDSVVKFT